MVMVAPTLTARPRVTLRVIRADGGPESSHPMTGETLACGRQADLSLPEDPFIAGVQTRFFFSAGKLAVEDVGGGNGTFARLRKPRELPTGGELRVGRQRLLLEPIPGVTPGAGGAIAWGSPDPGFRMRLVQLLEGGGHGSAFPLKPGENVLGREAGDITFPQDGFVSGRHALLTVNGDIVTVEDMASSNGTFLRVNAATFVDHGDQFLVGRELLRVELKPAQP